jgi:hypothetical protein
MSKNSLIYNNIYTYRFLMNLLYKGKYRSRFDSIGNLISGQSVTELCFGDTIIADKCGANNIKWTGLDVNEQFSARAKKKGYDVISADINTIKAFPKADTCIMCGSLYHFNSNLPELISKMLDCAPVIIISEPVKNLSSSKGIIGKIARASATVKGHKQTFRYTKDTLTETLSNLSAKLNFKIIIIEQFDKDLILVITK